MNFAENPATDVSQKLQHYYSTFQGFIRFRTPPVGYKHLTSKEEIPAGTYIPAVERVFRA